MALKTENKSDFMTWFEQYKKQATVMDIGPSDISAWFKKVQENQQPTRKILGGNRKVFKITFKRTETEIDNVSLYNEVYIPIIKILPMYFGHYNINYYMLSKESKIGNVGFAKHLLYYARNIANPKPDDQAIKTLETLVSKLGDRWANLGKEEEITLNVCVSTMAKHYGLIGYYGPNPGSCWRSPRHKWIVGLLPQSAVVLVYDTKHPVVGKVLMRGFCSINTEKSFVLFSNTYTKGLKTGDAQRINTIIAKKLLENEKAEFIDICQSIYSTDRAFYMQVSTPGDGIYSHKDNKEVVIPNRVKYDQITTDGFLDQFRTIREYTKHVGDLKFVSNFIAQKQDDKQRKY